MAGLPHKKKLTKEEQTKWEDRLKQYTTYLTIFHGVIADGVIPKIQGLKDSNEKKILLAVCDSFDSLYSKVYDILQDAFYDVLKNAELDFEAELPFPPPPLSMPTEDNTITWVQLGWGIISGALNIVVNSFAAIRVYWSPLEATVNTLIDDLGKIFGPPKEFILERAKDEPKEFPTMSKRDVIIRITPKKKLTAEEKKRWDVSLIQYAHSITVFENVVMSGVAPVLKTKIKEGPKKRVALANCDSMIITCGKIYTILKEAYDNVVKLQMLDFQCELPLPLLTLSAPTTNAVEAAQLMWGTVKTAVNLVALSFPAAKVYKEVLVANGNQLMKDLAETCGLPKDIKMVTSKSVPMNFPALTSRRGGNQV